MTKKTDRRKLRTKKMLRKAIIELIQEKGLKNVTVSDLTARADINRGTFYLHYRDVDDMLEQFQSVLLSELKENAKKIDIKHVIQHVYQQQGQAYPAFISIIEKFAEHADLIKVIIGPQGDPSFTSDWKQFVKERILEKLSESQPDRDKMLVPPEYLATFIASAHTGIIQHWIETGLKESPEEIASIITRIAVQGPISTIGLIEQ